MPKLIRLGGEWFEQAGFSLDPVAAPDPLPESGEFFDGDELATEFDNLTAPQLAEKVNELVEAYSTARTNASTDGGADAIEAARKAQIPALIAHHMNAQRSADLESLIDPEAAGTAPNAPADPAPNGDPEPGDDDADDGAGDENSDDDGSTGGGELLNVGAELTGSELATVAAAAAIMVRQQGGTPGDQLAALLPGAAPAAAGNNPTAEAPIERATFIAAAGLPAVTAGAEMGLDGMADSIRRWANAAKAGRVNASQILGTYQMYGASPTLIASGGMAKDGKIEAGSLGDFHARRAGHLGIVAAAPERCGPNDFRREVPDSGDISSPLLNALQSYPAPHCTLEHYQDISLSSVQAGITVWDDTARDAYQAALDAWRADVAGGGPYDPQLYANLKAAEKQCAIAGCPPTAVVSMLPIAACLEYPTDLEYCSPEAIRAYNRALNREFIRQRTANMLAVVTGLSSTVTVDAAAAPFVNAETIARPLGAVAVLDYVSTTLKTQGVMLERLTEGNYSLVIPYGLQRLLEMDNRFAGADSLNDAFPGVSQVVTALDVATGDTLPYGAVPAAGSTTAFVGNLEPPTDWSVYLLDLDDFFEISRPDIELGAQLTPESVRGNMVFGGFMESSAGYGKDGVHPAWRIDLSNLVYNGGRPDRVDPVGLLGGPTS